MRSLYTPVSAKKVLRIILLVGILHIPALRFYVKYFSSCWMPVLYVSCCISVYVYFIYYVQQEKIFGKSLISFLGIFLLLAYSYTAYPLFGNSDVPGIGSDADDAIFNIIQNLLEGYKPYEGRTYLGNLYSPGPGLIILLFPFVISGMYPAIPGILLFFAGWLLTKKWNVPLFALNAALIIVFSSPAFWELQGQGSDVFLMVLLMFILLLLKPKSEHHSLKKRLLLIGGAILILSSRIVFIYLVPFYAFWFAEGKMKKTLSYFIRISVGIAFIHSLFYFWMQGEYDPLLLMIKRGSNYSIFSLLIGCGIFAVIIYFFFQDLRCRVSLQKVLKWFFIWIAFPMSMIFIQEFIRRGLDVSSYAFTYLSYLIIPGVLYLVVKEQVKRMVALK